MCGIAGWIGPVLSSERLDAVRRAARALAHRGPDDAGLLVHDAAGDTRIEAADGAAILLQPASPTPLGAAVIGHRRLAIIDRTSAARQPMATADGRHVLVLNGEIYNYVELREELARLGHRFRSASDTEVLLAAFVQWGAACLPKLVGMFAFAVADLQAGTLFLARDCFGMKPLYYAACEGGLAFASEMKPLLELAKSPRRVDPQRLLDYLDFGATDHGDGTLVDGVRLLPPAHHAMVAFADPQQVDPERYWSPPLETELDLSFEEAAVSLRELFLENVRLHMRSDVRIGTLLSGGLDSSSVVMAMRELGGPSLDVHTFSYVPEPGPGAISEERWIDDVNAAARAVVHKVRIQPDEWARDFESLCLAQEAPFGSLAIYAQYRLFGAARDAGIGVVLGGQGSDELQGGYRSMWPDCIVSLLRRGHWIEAVRFWRRAGRSRFPGDPGRRSLATAALGRFGPVARVRKAIPRNRHLDLVDTAWFRARGVERREAWRATGRRAVRETLWHATEATSLPPLLRFEDRNSMAHSVESRLPFLTPRFAEFVLALPESYLIRGDGIGKAVFRQAMRGIVPASVLDRRDKVGFSVPLGDWLRRTEVLEPLQRAAGLPGVRRDRVDALAARIRSGTGATPAMVFRAWRLIGLVGSIRALQLDVR